MSRTGLHADQRATLTARFMDGADIRDLALEADVPVKELRSAINREMRKPPRAFASGPTGLASAYLCPPCEAA